MFPANFAVNFCCCADTGLIKPETANASTSNVAANAVVEIVLILNVFDVITARYIQLCKGAMKLELERISLK